MSLNLLTSLVCSSGGPSLSFQSGGFPCRAAPGAPSPRWRTPRCKASVRTGVGPRDLEDDAVTGVSARGGLILETVSLEKKIETT